MMVAAFYDLLLLLPLAEAISLILRPIFGGDKGNALWLVVTALAAVYLILVKHLKPRGRLILFSLSATLLISCTLYHPKEERLDFLKGNLWIAEIAGIVLLCFFIGLLSERYKYLRLILSAAGLIMLFICLINGIEVSKALVISVFGYGIISFADFRQRCSKKDGDSSKDKHLVFISPFILAVIIALSLIKVPTEPYDWGFVYKIAEVAKNGYAILADALSGIRWEGSSPVIGFSDRGTFGGNLTGGSYIVMDITNSMSPGPGLYLKGMVFDSFDGQSWESSVKEDLRTQIFDTLETMAAVMDVKGDGPVSDLAKRIEETTVSKGLNTSRSFYPPKSISEKRYSGRSYKTEYYRLNLSTPEIHDLLYNGHTPTPEGWNSALDECGVKGTEFPFENYLSYREKLFETCLPPTEISGRARDYMDKVLEGAETDYEKLLRIEELLRSFDYTDSPGELPKNLSSPSDYIDYLLFEKREGYCSYFATAFVILSRAYGIPSSYVQGYRRDIKDSFHVEISNTDAHAWPESYIDGVGWMIFEPTPGYAGSVASGWKTQEEMMAEGSPYIPDIPTDEGEDETNLNIPEDKAPRVFHWHRIVLPLAIGLSFTLFLLILDALLKRRRYRKLDEKGRVLWCCRRNMQLLKRKGFGRETHETLSEYRKRLSSHINEKDLAFLTLYEKILYSDKELTGDEALTAESSFKELKKALKSARKAG